jgi:hypothetical protein
VTEMKHRFVFKHGHEAIVLIAAIASLAFASSASASPVSPHWLSDGELIGQGAIVPVNSVRTEDKSFTLHTAGAEMSCVLTNKGSVTNPVGGGPGTDEITEFVGKNCLATPDPCPAKAKPELVAGKLPWLSHLVAGPPVKDVIEGIEIEVKCSNGTVLDTYTGTLTATVGVGVLEFGPESGALEDAEGNKATVTGTIVIRGPRRDVTITTREAEPTKLTTSLSGDSMSGPVITVPPETAVTDEATLSGANVSEAEGTVEYKVYSDSECKDLVAEAGTVVVSGGVVPPSNSETFLPGTYYWQASYSGDPKNEGSVSPCGAEIETVTDPHWYSDGELIAEGMSVPVNSVRTENKAFTLHAGGSAMSCVVTDKGTVTNPVGGGPGTDEITVFMGKACNAMPNPCPGSAKPELIGKKLPWLSHLVFVPPIRDVIEGVEIEVKCSEGAVLDSYSGTLTPTVGSSVLEFGPESGELEDAEGNKATITGTLTIKGPRKDATITAGPKKGKT